MRCKLNPSVDMLNIMFKYKVRKKKPCVEIQSKFRFVIYKYLSLGLIWLLVEHSIKIFTTLFNKTVQKKSIETKIIRLFLHVPKTKNEWINRLIQRAVKMYILASPVNILHTLLFRFKWLEWVRINVTTLDHWFRFR